MKMEWLTVKELAAELGMSSKSIQRAYRKEEIPVQSSLGSLGVGHGHI